MSDGGKGDKQRPTNHEAFANNFDQIFKNKPVRGSFVQCKETGKLIPKDEYYAPSENGAAYIQPDIAPYQSMITGEMITSRSQHRAHLKQHNCFEIGNEVNHAMKTARPKPQHDTEGLKRTLAEVLNSRRF